MMNCAVQGLSKVKENNINKNFVMKVVECVV